MHSHWPTINAAVKSALGEVTLEALGRRPHETIADQLAG